MTTTRTARKAASRPDIGVNKQELIDADAIRRRYTPAWERDNPLSDIVDPQDIQLCRCLSMEIHGRADIAEAEVARIYQNMEALRCDDDRPEAGFVARDFAVAIFLYYGTANLAMRRGGMDAFRTSLRDLNALYCRARNAWSDIRRVSRDEADAVASRYKYGVVG